MSDLDRYIPGVPCWADTTQPDPDAATTFYAGLFGWEFENVMPDGADAKYLNGLIDGGPAAAVGSIPEGAPESATWNMYVRVEDADATAARVRDAGGAILTEPFDVPSAGRMAVFADPEGAAFCVWQAREFGGAEVVNEHASVNFNDLRTREPESAKAFYGAVFGWQTLELGGPGAMWTLPGYGDHLETLNPGTRERMGELDAPKGFEDVVASMTPIGEAEAGVQPHWGITFAVDDADAIAAKASELGGTVVVPPMDAPWTRMTVIADPQGAAFTASKFVPENRDLAAPAGNATSAA